MIMMLTAKDICHPEKLEPYHEGSAFVRCPDCCIGYIRGEVEAVLKKKRCQR